MIANDSAPLTPSSVGPLSQRLAQIEPFFATVLEKYGPPPLWARPPGFATLVWIILEQQVSLASARAAFDRLQARLPEVTPAALLSLDDTELRAIGFSRQKTAYCRSLAAAILGGAFDLDRLETLSDAAAHAELVSLKGIGDWTAAIYLLMALRRADIWPAQDLGLVVAVRRAFNWERRPDRAEMIDLAQPWRPYRSVAARLFWHYYLSEIRPSK